MLTCPYCEPLGSVEKPSGQGMSSHIRLTHPDKWRTCLRDSIPEGFDIGRPEPRVTRHKGESEDARRKRLQRESYHRNKKLKRKGGGSTHVTVLPMLSRVKFCPHCGGNIEIINIALGMAEKAAQ